MDCNLYCLLLNNDIERLNNIQGIITEICNFLKNPSGGPDEGVPFPSNIVSLNNALLSRLRNTRFLLFNEEEGSDTLTLTVKKCNSCVTSLFNTTSFSFLDGSGNATALSEVDATTLYSEDYCDLVCARLKIWIDEALAILNCVKTDCDCT